MCDIRPQADEPKFRQEPGNLGAPQEDNETDLRLWGRHGGGSKGEGEDEGR